jgi:sarcosine oxidase delta subunit
MSALPERIITCPYCSEPNDILIEFSQDGDVQDYIEDCQVCCRPIHLIVETNGKGEMSVVAKGEDEV